MANVPLHQLTDVWTGGAAYKGISLNVTDTSSTFGSLLMDLQVGGVSKFTVRKDGTIALGSANAGGTVIYPSTNRAEFYRWDQTEYGGVMARDLWATYVGARTTDLSSLRLEDGWNNAAIDFRAIRLDVANTASGANSKLMDLRLDGVSQFAITKAGALLGPGVREKLNADRTYYVNVSTGNDTTGDGSSGTPWQTLQSALFRVARAIDLNGYTVKFELADGTYVGTTIGSDVTHPGFQGGGNVWIHGNDTTPTNVLINGSVFEAIGTGALNDANVFVSDCKLQSTSTNVVVVQGSILLLGRPGGGGRVILGRSAASWAFLMTAYGNGRIQDNSDSGIEIDVDTTTTPIAGIANVYEGGNIIMGIRSIAGTPAWSNAGFLADSSGSIYVWGVTGAATGIKYKINNNGSIQTSSTPDILPGSIDGILSIHTTPNPNLREKITANRTYYVRLDGNNANNGLADTAGGAFATVQYALDFIAERLDPNGFIITVQANTGTHAGFYFNKGIVGKGVISIQGSAVNNTDVILSGTTTAGAEFYGNSNVDFYIGGVKLESTFSFPLSVFNARVFLGRPDGGGAAVRFGKGANSVWPMILMSGSMAYCVTYSAGTTIDVDTSVNPAAFFVQAQDGAQLNFGPVAFAQTPTFGTAFVQADRMAIVTVNTPDASSGAAVGKRYNAIGGGVVRRTSGTGGINNLPGTIAGTWSLIGGSLSLTSSLNMGSGQLMSWADGGYIYSSAGKLHANNLSVDDTTASTSSTTGALTVAGGAGVAGDVRIGGNHYQDSPYIRTDHAAGFILHNKAGTDYQVLSAKGFWTGSFVPMTANLPAYESDITWNNAAVNFRGVKFNANITACGADSRLIAVYRDQNPKWFVRYDGAVISYPPASAVPASNGELTWEATSNTLVTARMKGSDSTVRSGGIQLGGPLTGVVTVSTSDPSGGNDGDVWYKVT